MAVNIISGTVSKQELAKNGTVMVVHGGAGPVDPKGDDVVPAHHAICKILNSTRNGSEALPYGFLEKPNWHVEALNSAEKRALFAATLLEDEPLFNAGFGAALQSDGNARVSASYMNSTRKKFSSVMNVSAIKHPILLAYYLQKERFCSLDSTGSNHLARELQIPSENLLTQERFEKWANQKRKTLLGELDCGRSGTIGSVCIDAQGTLAACTSTGGVGNETVGRVGDSPTVAGNFCTENIAISCTGYGEQILADATAARIATRVDDGQTLQQALEKTIAESEGRSHEIGVIAVAKDSSGAAHWAAATTLPFFVWGKCCSQGVKGFMDYFQ